MAAAARVPKEAFVWAAKIDEAQSADELAENGSLYESRFSNLDFQIATGLLETLPGEFKRKAALRKDKYASQKPPQMITAHPRPQQDHQSGQ